MFYFNKRKIILRIILLEAFFEMNLVKTCEMTAATNTTTTRKNSACIMIISVISRKIFFSGY